MSYFLIEGEKFYPLECKEERLFICNKVYPQEQSLSLEIGKEENKLCKDLHYLEIYITEKEL